MTLDPNRWKQVRVSRPWFPEGDPRRERAAFMGWAHLASDPAPRNVAEALKRRVVFIASLPSEAPSLTVEELDAEIPRASGIVLSAEDAAALIEEGTWLTDELDVFTLEEATP